MAKLKAPFSVLPQIKKNLSISTLFLILILCFTACFNPWYEGTGNIVISFGGNSSGARSSLWPPEDYEILEQIKYFIVLSGNDEPIEFEADGKDIIRKPVSAGLWTVYVEAFYKNELYAKGDRQINVIAGKDNSVIIPMTNLNLICPDCKVDEKEAACEIPGWKIITCEIEKHNAQISIDPLEHSWSEWEGIGAPTCTEDGAGGERHCKQDGCEVMQTGDGELALGHFFGDYISNNDAACTVDGTETARCIRYEECGYFDEQTDVSSQLGHDFDWDMSGIKTCKRNDCNANPAVGDTGPAGGIIFYIVPTGFTVQGYTEGTGLTAYLNFITYTAYYFEAAPSVVTTLLWASIMPDLIPGLSQNSTDQTDWEIGRGRMNTAIIIARGIEQEYTTPAASACAALDTGDKDDWFLPSRNELNLLAQIRGQHGIPNIGVFWSSSAGSIYSAWCQDFDDGFQGFGNRVFIDDVRPVRAF